MNRAEPDQHRAASPVEAPCPPRYWWLKRIGLLVLLLLAALGVTRWWWGRLAAQRYEAMLAEFRALGQPTRIADLIGPGVDPGQNAACALLEAADLIQPSAASQEFIQLLEGIGADHRLIEAGFDELTWQMQLNQPAFEALRRARDLPACDWPIDYQLPLIGTLLPPLGPVRRCANLLAGAALYSHHTGDDAAAVEFLRDHVVVAHRATQMRGFLIGHLVAVAIYARATQTVEALAADLAITPDGGPLPDGGRSASHAQVRALLADLLADQDLRESWYWSMAGERLMQILTVDDVASGRISMADIASMSSGPRAAGGLDRIAGGLLGPAWRLDSVRMGDWSTQVLNAGLQPDLAAARSTVPNPKIARFGPALFSRTLSAMLYPSLGNAVTRHFEAAAKRRMAAVALALRMYAIDHGRPAAALRELVPDYLPAIPTDPLSPDGRPLAYANYGGRLVLYSVGTDQKDDAGRFETGSQGEVKRDAADLPFFVDGPAPGAGGPHTQPASQPASGPSGLQ